jgi:rhodanese-related sulfurtransferase
MTVRTLCLVAATACSLLLAPAAQADNKAIVTDEMEAYLEFVDYGGGVIFAEQIPKDEWPKMMVIDARDSAQFAKGHIPGAVNMDWRQVLAKRNTIPKNKPVLIYCNTAWQAGTTCAFCKAAWRSGKPKAALMQRPKRQDRPSIERSPC